MKNKLLNSEILAEVLMSEKERKVKRIEKQLYAEEEAHLDSEFSGPKSKIDKKLKNAKIEKNPRFKKYPKPFRDKMNAFTKQIYDVNTQNVKLYEKCQKMTKEVQDSFNNLSRKISQLSKMFDTLSANFKILDHVKYNLRQVKHFKNLENEQKLSIGKENDHSTVSLNYDLLKAELDNWSESYKQTAQKFHFFMDPYFEKNLNRFKFLDKSFKQRNNWVMKKQKEEAKLRLDSVVHSGFENPAGNFDYRKVKFLDFS